jgi:protein-tyrosine phosphatase
MQSGLTDLHCHALPGVDDGAATVAQSLALLSAAYKDGIRRVLLTPHIDPERWDNRLDALLPRFVQLRRSLALLGLDVELALAAEVTLSAQLPAQLERGDLPLMAGADGARSLLLELPHGGVPAGAAALVEWLARRGVRTLIAHPERNAAVMRDSRCLDALRAQGAALQVTAGSLLGVFGARARVAAERLLGEGAVALLATDAHDLRHRPPQLGEGARAAAAVIGESRAWDLATAAPLAFAGGSFQCPRQTS